MANKTNYFLPGFSSMLFLQCTDLFKLPAQLDLHGRSIFLIKRPADCSQTEIDLFLTMVKKGNKVSADNLRQKVLNCEFLAFSYSGKRLVGISAIKRPEKSYIEQVHQKAGILRNTAEFGLELGYSFTEQDFRRSGISKKLKELLLRKISGISGTIFSTTATPTSQRFLRAHGFSACGSPYQGKFDGNIIYFEKTISM